jgi:putative ABC transport system substrate-binding protein
MRRRDVIAGLLSAVAQPALGHQAAEPYRIAIAHPSQPLAELSESSGSPLIRAIFEELRRLGYVEGRNLVVERYSGGGRAAHYPELAREVARRNPDVIITFTNNLVLDFKAATTTIPITAIFADPTASGIVSSLGRPGGNITGVSVDVGPDQWGKRLALLHEALPRMSRVGLIASRNLWALARDAAAIREAELKLGVSLVGSPLDHPIQEAEYRRVFAVLAQEGADGLIVSDETESVTNQRSIVDLAERGPAADSLSLSAVHRGGRAHGLRNRPSGPRTPRRRHGPSSPKGQEAGRSAGPAADQIRAGDQSQDRKRARPNDPARASRPRRRGNRIAMPPSDLDITRTAHLWIQQRGDEATAKARPNVDQMRRKGDIEADVWLRIIVAIGTLGTPPMKSRH